MLYRDTGQLDRAELEQVVELDRDTNHPDTATLEQLRAEHDQQHPGQATP